MMGNQSNSQRKKRKRKTPYYDSGNRIVPAVYKGDRLFNNFLRSVTLIVLIILMGIFITLLINSIPSIREFGLSFFSIDIWHQPKLRVSGLKMTNLLNDKMGFEIKFNGVIDPDSVESKYFSIEIPATGERISVEVVPILSGFTNQALVIPQQDPTPGVEYILVVDKKIRDQFKYPLADKYLCNFMLKATDQPETPISFSLIDIKGEKLGTIYREMEESEQRWYGALPFIVGTLWTSMLALFISLPFSLSIAIFLGEYFTSGPLSTVLKTTNELLAGIPSVIYGFWAYFYIAPLVWKLFPYQQSGGSNILSASIVLAIMIIPYTASLAREVIALVPNTLKEAAYAMGATHFEVIRRVIVPYTSSGIFAGILLAFGRALGETMAVTMVIGNKNEVPSSIFSSAQTIASLIANNFNEAKGLKLSALTELGMILFLITLVFGLLGRYIIKRLSIK